MGKSVLAKLKQNYQEQSTAKRALWSGTFNAVSTFSWYALPDYLPSRKSRSAIKVLLLAGEIAAGWIMGVIPSLQINLKDADKRSARGAGMLATVTRMSKRKRVNILGRGNPWRIKNPADVASRK